MNDENLIHGSVAAGFEAVKSTFAEVVAAENGQLSAQLAAYHHGKLVVDLWSGPETTADALFDTYSASKGAGALVVALLLQDGLLSLDEKVSYYWPEFAAKGKQTITLRQLMSHQAGLPGADHGFTADELTDDRRVAEQLARQRPYWNPGSAFGYHALVFGALLNEVVCRVTGRTVQQHFSERVQQAYNVDFFLGQPEALDPRYQPTLSGDLTPEKLAELLANAPSPDSISGIAFNRHHPDNPPLWTLVNSLKTRRSGTISFGGVASARGLAKMYAVAMSSVDNNSPLLTPETLAQVTQIQSRGEDLVLKSFKAFSVGFHATAEYYPSLGQGAFGHSGAGGQQAFADPRHGLSYGYTRRQFPLPFRDVSENDQLISALSRAAAALS